jgi:Uri superfamily endonuclease
LGEVALGDGCAVYVGSAFGPGGLAGRLRHHLKPLSRRRWHLDYLRPALELWGGWIGAGPRCVEHEWASIFAELPSASVPHPRFGASDCRCSSHLFHWRRAPGQRRVVERLLAESGARTVDFLPAARLVSLVVPQA